MIITMMKQNFNQMYIFFFYPYFTPLSREAIMSLESYNFKQDIYIDINNIYKCR